MTSKMFDELDALSVLLLPKFQMAILAGGYNKIFSKKDRAIKFRNISGSVRASHTFCNNFSLKSIVKMFLIYI